MIRNMSLISKELENTIDQFFVCYLSLVHKKKNRKKKNSVL